jgi:hypothetical protein
LHSLILRHIRKKDFTFFEPLPAHLQSKFKKVLIRATKKNFFKNSIWVSKNAEFHAYFESVKKGLKKCTKKVISKNLTEICTPHHGAAWLRWCGVALWCGVAQLVACRLAVRQARVRFSARHHREGLPTELSSDEEMERGPSEWRRINVLYECD